MGKGNCCIELSHGDNERFTGAFTTNLKRAIIYWVDDHTKLVNEGGQEYYASIPNQIRMKRLHFSHRAPPLQFAHATAQQPCKPKSSLSLPGYPDFGPFR